MDEDLVLHLKKFGMNEYEAKVYSALFELRVPVSWRFTSLREFCGDMYMIHLVP